MLSLERHNAAMFDRHCAEFRPDRVAWWAMGGMSLSLIERARRAGLGATAVVVDDWPLYGPDVDVWSRRAPGRPRFARALELVTGIPARYDLEHACRWLFASRTLASRVREAGLDPTPAEVAHPGIDLELFREPPEPRPGWRWKLAYVGRIDERKGIDLAVGALAELPAEATLDDSGRRETRATARRCERTIDELGLGGRVTFGRRPRDELPAVYAAADAVLFPVRWEEPFGLVPLEAMACGAPVVASGRGGSSEYLRDGENCVLFDADGGSPALAEAVRRLAGDPGLRGSLHDAGLATAAEHDEHAFNAAVLRALADPSG